MQALASYHSRFHAGSAIYQHLASGKLASLYHDFFVHKMGILIIIALLGCGKNKLSPRVTGAVSDVRRPQ